MSKHSDAFVQKKWDEFANIPITNDDKLDQSFYLWKKGTDKMLVWHWFDEHYSKGVAALAGIAN
jgi:hypothetical protein